jgi:hypothetical protein
MSTLSKILREISWVLALAPFLCMVGCGLIEDSDWEQVKNYGTITDYQDFLKKYPEACKRLLLLLNHPYPTIRSRSAAVLGKIKDKRAIEPLIEQLKDEHSSTGQIAAESLEEITEQLLGNDYDAWSKWWKENKQKYQSKEDR